MSVMPSNAYSTPLGSCQQRRPRPWAVGLVHAVLGLFSLWLAGQPGHVATVWLPNPVGAVALALAPPAAWPGLLIALMLGNAGCNLAYGLLSGAGSNLDMGTFLWAWAFVPGNLIEMALGGWLLRRLKLDQDALLDPFVLLRVLLLGGVLPAWPSALAGAGLLSLETPDRFESLFVTWLCGDILGAFAMLPVVLCLMLPERAAVEGAPARPATHPRRLWSAQALVAYALGVGTTVLASTSLPQPFVVIVVALMFVAISTNMATTAATGLWVVLTLDILIGQGLLQPPPATSAWHDALFYLAMLSAITPGIFLAASAQSQRATIEALKLSRERMQRLYTQTPVMLQSVDPQGRIMAVSQRWLDVTGYREESVLGRPITDFLRDTAEQIADRDTPPRYLGEDPVQGLEYRMLTRDGGHLDVLVASRWELAADGRPWRNLGVIEDITERKRLAARSHYAEHDPLTGLPNRILMSDRLRVACANAARHGTSLAVGFLDIDRFKQINDTHGHGAGDELLRAVAQRLAAALRASDSVGRWAGDEFVLLLSEGSPAASLDALIARIHASLSSTPVVMRDTQGRVVTLTVHASLGLARFPQDGRDEDSLLAHADRAMYAHKQSRRTVLAGLGMCQ